VVLVAGCIFAGWHPNAVQLLAAVAGFLIVGLLATGLGLLFGAANVYFRDSENLVDMLLMVATWASPVMYAWTMVQEKLGDGWFAVYQANPITIGVELFHYAFWFPTTDGSAAMPPALFSLWLPVGLAVALAVVILGQFTFRRLEGRFAQEL
jgi:ABC-2 type transport system permease protein